MPSIDLRSAAEQLHQARRNRQSREQLTKDFEDLDIAKAYQIQKMGIDLRKADGENVIGMKMGLTSETKRQQMGLDSPCYGYLTQEMRINDRGSLSMGEGIHPKVEAEVAFFFEEPISSDMSEAEIIAKCTGIAPALEILDTRYTAFKYFSIEDVVADNSSSYKFVLGEPRPLSEVNYKDLTLEMTFNDKVAATGNSSAISGDPIQSVLQLMTLTKQNNQTFQTPGFILAGAATPAINIEPNTEVKLKIDGFDPISFTVTK